MLNRFLFLLVAVVSPASSVAILLSGHPAGIAWTERVPCSVFTLIALGLAALHARPTTDRSAPFEAAMWLGLATLLGVAAYAAPHVGVWSIVALLTLAGTSIVRLVARAGRRPSMARIVGRGAAA